MSRCPHSGISIFCHFRKAPSRNSSIHSGSSLSREMVRMMSSFSFGNKVLADIGDEALLVLLSGDLLNYLVFFLNVHSNK